VNGLTPADRAALATADVAVISVKGRQAMAGLSAELQALQKARKPVFAVGAIDDSLRELGVRDDKPYQAYHAEGGVENIGNLLRYILRNSFGSQ
jgi:cobaltochelatase CobN